MIDFSCNRAPIFNVGSITINKTLFCKLYARKDKLHKILCHIIDYMCNIMCKKLKNDVKILYVQN